jgi:hypothetical protein
MALLAVTLDVTLDGCYDHREMISDDLRLAVPVELVAAV